ncbi:MAG: D-Ala-D-Ala carboxypeptidase family metallohydrolase [Rickettsiales bacterium]
MGDLSQHFSRHEFKCKCGECDFDTVDADLVAPLEYVRQYLGKPITITSGCRCDKYNNQIGGSPRSQHKYGRAADIVVRGVDAVEVYELLNASPFRNDISLGKYENFTHVDTRTNGPKRW